MEEPDYEPPRPFNVYAPWTWEPVQILGSVMFLVLAVIFARSMAALVGQLQFPGRNFF